MAKGKQKAPSGHSRRAPQPRAPRVPRPSRPSADAVKVVFLGGLGEIGRNCAAIEQDGRILFIDCGVMFPEPDMLGVDVIIPDFTWLADKLDRIDGVVLTHGHEDHAGALSYLARQTDISVYGSALSLALARPRIEDARLLRHVDFVPVVDGERRRIGVFDVEFVAQTHSVPSAFALAIRTPQGIIVHTGDFKIDLTPIDGRRADLTRLAHLAATEGVRLLLSDSTNAESPGFTDSEASIGPVLRQVFAANPTKRIIVSCFASHLHRIQQVIDAAVLSGRKVATLGRSMQRNIELGIDLELLEIPHGTLISLADAEKLPRHQVCVLSTGSQGETLSAMTLLARDANRFLSLESSDLVVLSAHPIPGNEHAVGKVIDDLHRRGVEVVHSGHHHVHVSGHARRGELGLMLQLCQPDYFIPVHGEFRHLVHHTELAEQMGMARDHVVLCEDGDVAVLRDDAMVLGQPVPASYVYVDGNTVDLGGAVVATRRTLADEGLVVVACAVDVARGKLLATPTITAHGWLPDERTTETLEAAVPAVEKTVLAALKEPDRTLASVEKAARRTLGRHVGEKTRRKPMIVPVILDASA